MDTGSGFVGTRDEVWKKIKADGRDPEKDMVLIDGPPEAIERVSRAVAAHKPNVKARRKAQRAARRRNR